jgi:hypothetical protein
MAFVGFAEVLLIVMLSGNVPADAVSFIPTAHYFKSRNVEASIDKLVDLAKTDPIDPKTQIMQLVAMKALAEDIANLKKAKNLGEHRKTLEDIASGKKAADPAGFAKDYAAKLLAALDGTPLPMPAELPARVYEDGLRWFPANVQFASVMDNRVARNEAMVARFVASLQPLIPDKEKGQIYDAIEKIGNVELHRMAFAMREEPRNAQPEEKKKLVIDRPDTEIFIRLTGRANRLWLAELLAREGGSGFKIEHSKGPSGEDMTYVKKGVNDPPAMVFIGSTEMLMCGYERTGGRDHNTLLEKCLNVRAGKEDSALKGPLVELLKKTPNKAHGVVAGKLPNLFGRGAPFSLPSEVLAYALRTPQGQDLAADLTMEDKESAMALTQLISQGRTSGLEALKKVQNDLPPNVNTASIINTLESLQVQAKENVVSVRILITDDAVMSFPALMFGLRAGF